MIRTLVDLVLGGRSYRLVHVPGGRTAIDDRSRESHAGPCCQLQLDGCHVWCAPDRQACFDAATVAGAPEAFLSAVAGQPGVPGSMAAPQPVAGGSAQDLSLGDQDEELDALSFRALQARAKELGLSAGGTADELVARIQAHTSALGAPGGGAEGADGAE